MFRIRFEGLGSHTRSKEDQDLFPGRVLGYRLPPVPEPDNVFWLSMWGFPEIRGPVLGVPMIRVLVCWGSGFFGYSYIRGVHVALGDLWGVKSETNSVRAACRVPCRQVAILTLNTKP